MGAGHTQAQCWLEVHNDWWWATVFSQTKLVAENNSGIRYQQVANLAYWLMFVCPYLTPGLQKYKHKISIAGADKFPHIKTYSKICLSMTVNIAGWIISSQHSLYIYQCTNQKVYLIVILLVIYTVKPPKSVRALCPL